MNNFFYLLIALLISSLNVSAQDIMVEYCGGDMPAVLKTQEGNEEDGYEWFVLDSNRNEQIIGTEQTIEIDRSLFNQPVFCRRACACGTDYFYETFVPYRAEKRVVNLVTTPTSCLGLNDGSAILEVKEEEGLKYYWNDGKRGKNRMDLEAGAYRVTVSGQNGCTDVVHLNIEAPPKLSIVIEKSPTSCSGIANGKALVVSKDKGHFNYEWNTGNTTKELDHLPVGDYSVKVFNEKGCTIENIEIAAGKGIEANIQTISDYNGVPLSCHNSRDAAVEIRFLKGVPPFQLAWKGEKEKTIINHLTTIQKSNLSSGKYPIEIKDAIGCIYKDTIDIISPRPVELLPIMSNFNGFGVKCNGGQSGSIDINAKGGTSQFSYKWYKRDSLLGGHSIIQNLKAGRYKIIVADQNGCQKDTTIRLIGPKRIKIKRDVIKVGNYGRVSIQPSGGTGDYAINNDRSRKKVFSEKLPIRVHLSIEDSNGCIMEKKIFVGKKGGRRKKTEGKSNPKKSKSKRSTKRMKCPVWN